MLVTILLCACGIILGAGLVYVALSPKVKHTQEIDNQIIKQNQEAKQELNQTQEKLKYLKTNYDEKYQEFYQLRTELEKEQQMAENSAKTYYDKMMGIYRQKLQYSLDKEKEDYQSSILAYQEEYLKVLDESSESFQQKLQDLHQQTIFQQEQLDKLTAQVSVESSTAQAAVEANKRIAEQALQKDFYKLVLSSADLEEIEELRKCGRHLRNPEPLNKVIWKVYYENPYTNLIGRVIGSGIHCGIYKITNLQNGMCYVGQAVNIGR